MKIKVITFNMRMQTKQDGDNMFLNRLPFILEYIEREKPDIIGCQELVPLMRASLVRELSDYYITGSGRGANNFDESNSIVFLKNRFALSECSTFWLSHTPSVPGSRYAEEGQSGCPRICTYAKFVELSEGRTFRIYNTHLDHIGSIPRQYGMKQILEQVNSDYKNSPMPFVITGDMNAEPDAKEIRCVVENEFVKIIEATVDIPSSFHGFSDEGKSKIDYIFVNGDAQVLSCYASKEKQGNLYLSDHYPLVAELEI